MSGFAFNSYLLHLFLFEWQTKYYNFYMVENEPSGWILDLTDGVSKVKIFVNM